MATPAPNHSHYLDRTGISALTGASPATVNYWHLHRDHTGFPDPDHTDTNGRDQWHRRDIEAFQITHRADRATSFTTIDRTGDPDELLTAPQAARVLNYANHRSLPPTMLNCPDDVTELPSGRLRRRWYRRTIWTFADTRPDRHSTGRPTGTGRPTKPTPAYSDDPRLAIARHLLDTTNDEAGLAVRLARQLAIPERTAQRLLAAARDHTHRSRREGST